GLDVADFNGNGRPDLVVSTYGGGFKLYLSNANGSFSNGMSGTISPSDFNTLKAGDFNEDGKMDVVFASNNGSDVIFLTGAGNGNFNLPPFRLATSDSHMTDAAVADIDNDGRPDAILLEAFSSQARLFRNVCSSRFTNITIESSGSPSTYPQNVTFTVRVTPRGGFLVPTGNVTLTDNGNFVGTKPLVAGAAPSALATFTLTKPSVGSHNIVATYAGDGNYGSVSTNFDLTVVRPPFGAPLDVVAFANAGHIDVQWVGSNGTASYDVLRMNAGTWEVNANTTTESI